MEFTFTTLVTFGGVFSHPSPCFMQPVLEGHNWLWNGSFLFCLIIQAVAYESGPNPITCSAQKLMKFFYLLMVLSAHF